MLRKPNPPVGESKGVALLDKGKAIVSDSVVQTLVGRDAQYVVIADNQPQVPNLQHPVDQGQSLIFALAPLTEPHPMCPVAANETHFALFLLDRVWRPHWVIRVDQQVLLMLVWVFRLFIQCL